MDDNDWCSTHEPISATDVGSVAEPLCIDYDGIYHSLPFTPNQAYSGGVLCDDQDPNWVYSVDSTPFAAEEFHLKVNIDSEASLIWVKGLTSGTVSATYTITITGVQ